MYWFLNVHQHLKVHSITNPQTYPVLRNLFPDYWIRSIFCLCVFFLSPFRFHPMFSFSLSSRSAFILFIFYSRFTILFILKWVNHFAIVDWMHLQNLCILSFCLLNPKVQLTKLRITKFSPADCILGVPGDRVNSWNSG